MSSVADKVKQFEKNASPTSATGSSKVAELKAKLEKASSPTNAAATVSPPSRPVVVKSSSATKLGDAGTSTEKLISRSASASKLTATSLLPNVEDVEAKPNTTLVNSIKPKTDAQVPRTASGNSLVDASLPAEPTISPRPSDLNASLISSVGVSVPLISPRNSDLRKEIPVIRAAEMKKVPSSSSIQSSDSREDALPTKGPLTLKSTEETPVDPVVKGQSPTAMATSKLLLAADALIPPTVEQQDFYVLWGLSFVVPFFLLRFVFEIIRKFVLGPARMAVRFSPGGNTLMSYLYVKLGPIVVKLARAAKERLPPMDSVNTAAKAGLEKFLHTLQTAGGAAYPHLLHLAESIKTLKFREAAVETTALLKAWAPMLLLLIPFTKALALNARQAWLFFWRVSKTAFYLPFGRLLRKGVQSFGQALSENPDVFAERVAGLLGPIVGFFVTFIVVFGVGVQIGLVDYETLSSMYIAWLFRLLGLVSEPSLLDQAALRTADDGGAMNAVAGSIMGDLATGGSGDAVDAANAAAAGGKGFMW